MLGRYAPALESKMHGFEAMSDGDLILCVNLLHADARDYEQMSSDAPEATAILLERAAERRALATRMKAEVDRRGAERWGRVA